MSALNPYLKLPPTTIVSGRQETVIDRCRNRRVLHVGCVDSGLMEDRFARGELMHQKLALIADELWGIDTDEVGIQYLRDAGFDHLYVADASELGKLPALADAHFEVIVCSEVVEHMLNPGAFFQSVKTLMVPGRTKLIVTVPNAFRIDTLLWLVRNVEFNHPDHNFWFSYGTITNLVLKNGYQVDELYVYSFQPRLVLPSRLKRRFRRDAASVESGKTGPAMTRTDGFLQRAGNYLRSVPKRALVSWLYRQSPFWGDGLIVIAALPDGQETGHA